MAIVTIIFVLVAGTVVFWLPGLLALEALAPGKYTGARLGLGLAVGVALVCYIALTAVGFIGLAAPLFLSPPIVLLTSLAVALLSLLVVSRREGSLRAAFTRLKPGSDAPLDWRLALFLAAVTLLYLVTYDGAAFDQERCISRACLLPVHPYLASNPPLYFDGCLDCFAQRNAFFEWNGHQRMGPSVLVAPFVSLFGLPGFRLLHALMGLLAAWFGFAVGRDKLGHDGYGYLAGFLMACNPWALSISLVDENILALGLGSVLLYLLLARRTQWVLVGLFFGLFLGIRHIGLLALPAVFYAVLASREKQHYSAPWYHRVFGTEPFANVTLLGLSLAFFSLPWLYVHIRAWATGLPLYESFAGLPATPHSFLGLDFTLNGLLNWPFSDSLVRSPFNGFPNLVALPLQVIGTLGLVGLAALALGLARAWRHHRRGLLLALLWTVPPWLVFAVAANWVEPNKAGLFLCFIQPVVLGVATGVRAAIEAYREDRFARPALVAAGIILVGGGLMLMAPSLQVPLDERNIVARPSYAAEVFPVQPPMVLAGEADLAAADRERLARVSVAPDYRSLVWVRAPRLLRSRLSQLWDDLSQPRLTRYCPRPKDVLHSLSGIPAPGTGKTVPLALMMHRPVTRFATDDTLPAACTHDTDSESLVALELSLESPPVSAAPLSGVPGAAMAQLPVAGDKVLFTSLGPLSWSDGEPVHVAAIPGARNEVWLFVWYGRYRFDHLSGQENILPFDSSAPPRLAFAVSGSALIRVVNVSSVVPNRFHVTLVPADALENAVGPFPSSY